MKSPFKPALAFCCLLIFSSFALADDKEMSTTYQAGSGVTFETRDGHFKASLGARLQVRYTYTDVDTSYDWDIFGDPEEEDTSSFSVRRMKLWLKGHAYDERLTFKFQANFAATQANDKLEDAYFRWKQNQYFAVQAGQFKVPFARQEMTSSGKQSFVDRSPVTGAFKIGREPGVMISGSFLEGHKIQYHLSATNGNGMNSDANDTNTHLVVGRLSFNPFGDFKYSESDLNNTKGWVPHIDLAYGVHRASNETDYDGNSRNDKLDITMGELSLGLRGHGFFLEGSYFMRESHLDLPKAMLLAEGEPTQAVEEEGWFLQAGYFFVPGKFELVGRYSEYDPDTSSLFKHDRETDCSLGFNWFFDGNGHNLKWQTDISQMTYEAKSLTYAKDMKTAQLKGLEFRTQFQIIF